MKVNANFDNLVPNYLFADVARKTNEYIAANPDKPVIRMGIGDVTLPLCKAAVDALKKGAEDLAHKESFKTTKAMTSSGRPSRTTIRASAWT